jgi:hypothetical protein
MVGEQRALRAHHPAQQPPPSAIRRIVAPRTIGRVAIRIVSNNRNAPRDLVPGAVATRPARRAAIPEPHRAVDVI